MSRRILQISGWLAALSVALGVGAVAAGSIAYVMTRVNESLRWIGDGSFDSPSGILITPIQRPGLARVEHWPSSHSKDVLVV